MKIYQDLINSIKRGVISPVYLFCGVESYLRDKAVAALKNSLAGGDVGSLNLTLLDGSEVKVEEIVDTANTLPLFAAKRLVIVENTPLFKNRQRKNEQAERDEERESAGDRLLLDYLQHPNPATCLVFTTDENINHKKKVVKAIERVGRVMEFAPVKGRELEEWVVTQFAERGKKIDREALDYLLAINSSDLGILRGEIEKLSLMHYGQAVINLAQVKTGASSSLEANIFDLVDYIGEKKSAQAIELVREMLAQNEPGVRLLYMITRQVRLILAAKSLAAQGYAANQLPSSLGVHPFLAKKLVQQSRNFSVLQLESALESCLETDLALKSSQGAPGVLLELAILCICSGQSISLMA